MRQSIAGEKRTALIMTNGDYAGEKGWYRNRAGNYPLVICVDGGANVAAEMGIQPDIVVGDLDSIHEHVRIAAERSGVTFVTFPPEKDSTDTHLAMELAREKGFVDLVIWGGSGSRLDHSLANLFYGVSYRRKGVDVRFESPDVTVYFVMDQLHLPGEVGDTVSVLALGEQAEGVCLRGFHYPLSDAILSAEQPIGVSNVIAASNPEISLTKGMLAVFHYRGRV